MQIKGNLTEKSHVSMEKKICLVCGKEYETNSILLDRRMRPSMERYTVTGMGLCPDDQKKSDDGYIALIGCDPEKSIIFDGCTKMENAHRTGAICHIREEAFKRIFHSVEIPEGRFLFVDQEVIRKLEHSIR